MTAADFYELWKRFGKKKLSGVPIAIALGGSRGVGLENPGSDWDFNIFFDNFDHMAESCIGNEGYFQIGSEVAHWYLHSLNSFYGNDNTILSCLMFWAKLPLMKEGAFVSFAEKGDSYVDFLKKNSRDISFFSINNIFSRCEGDVLVFASQMKGKVSGLMELGNHFSLSCFSKEDVLRSKNAFDNLPEERFKEILDFLEKLRKYSENYRFPTLDMANFWDKELKAICSK